MGTHGKNLMNILTHNRRMRSAIVVGAQGVIGRYIVEKLASLPDWRVVGLSRRRGQDARG
jgi:NAD(P)-dependent dehydrogenase (short-subunit alcohol dehydrogenase family)